MQNKIIPDTATSACIKLRFPVQLADRKLKDVTMRRPTMGDLLDYEPRTDKDLDGEVTLIGVLCGLKLEEMRKVDPTDYARLQDQYVRFRAVPEQEADTQPGGGPDAPDALGA